MQNNLRADKDTLVPVNLNLKTKCNYINKLKTKCNSINKLKTKCYYIND